MNTFNSVSRLLESDAEARLAIAKRLAAVMEPKVSTGDATDCSRLAWALIHSGETERALEFIDRGLQLDSNNEHCRKVKATLWERIAENERARGHWLEFLDATVHIVEVPGTDMAVISAAANTFNQLARQLDSNPDARRNLAQRLVTVMEPRIAEGDATDCSRLAWILVHAGKIERVLGTVERGLKMDPSNEHCQSLKTRFGAEFQAGV